MHFGCPEGAASDGSAAPFYLPRALRLKSAAFAILSQPRSGASGTCIGDDAVEGAGVEQLEPLQDASHDPEHSRPGSAERPAGQHIGRPMHAEINPAQAY